MWGSRSVGCPTTSTSGTAAAAARTRSTSARACLSSSSRAGLGLLPGLGGGQRQGHPGGVPAATEAGLAGRPGQRPAGAFGHREHAKPARAAPRLGVAGEHVVGSGGVDPPEGGLGVHDQRYAGGSAHVVGRAERLEGPHLAVGVLHGGGCGAGLADRLREGGEVHPAGAVDRHLGEQPFIADLGGPVAAGGQHRGVLDGGGDQAAAAPPPRVQGPVDGQSHGGRARRREGELGGTDPQACGKHLDRLVEQAARGASLGVETPRVGPAGVHRGHQRVPGDGVHGGAGGVEDRALTGVVRHTSTLVPP